MDANALNNLKRAEEALAKIEKERSGKKDFEFGMSEASKLPAGHPVAEELRAQRIAYETRIREEEAKRKQSQDFKIKKAKRLDENSARHAQEDRERKVKAQLDVVGKLNGELQIAEQALGKVIQFIDANEKTFQERPILRVKAQRTKRMLSAFYFGLKQAKIIPSRNDFGA